MNREIVGGGGASIYPLSGDVKSTAGSSLVSVVGIQGIPFQHSFPAGGEVPLYDAPTNSWIPTIPPSAVVLKTNGTPNSTQTLLNLQAGTNITLTETAGTVLIAATALGTQRSATTTNANGSFWTWTDGIIEQFGSITIASSGTAFGGGTITFPTTFPTGIISMNVSIVGLPNSGSTDTADVQVATHTGSGAVVNLQCSVPTGGGGTTFNQSVQVQWRAIGN